MRHVIILSCDDILYTSTTTAIHIIYIYKHGSFNCFYILFRMLRCIAVYSECSLYGTLVTKWSLFLGRRITISTKIIIMIINIGIYRYTSNK